MAAGSDRSGAPTSMGTARTFARGAPSICAPVLHCAAREPGRYVAPPVTVGKAEDLEPSAPPRLSRRRAGVGRAGARPVRPRGSLGTRAFIVLVVAAVPIYLFLGRNRWFYLDEWDLLARRTTSWSDLMRPHNEHWYTIPILKYRALWRLFGLRTYVPYQLAVILLHLAAAVLLWLIARRSGARLWCATVAASVFVYFGFGSQDILWAFQVGFDGALVLGLAQLLLAGHDGPVDRRDALGVICGVVGLLVCSGVAVVMVGIVAVAMWAAPRMAYRSRPLATSRDRVRRVVADRGRKCTSLPQQFGGADGAVRADRPPEHVQPPGGRPGPRLRDRCFPGDWPRARVDVSLASTFGVRLRRPLRCCWERSAS